MIKFFRNIRKGFIKEKKFPHYLIYAIGEIFLVVIGILIALQVNNWNLDKQNEELEHSYLREISNSLHKDSLHIENITKRNAHLLRLSKNLKEHMKNNGQYSDSLNKTFAQISLLFNYDCNSEAFESLKSNGVNLIKNDSLRYSIMSYYNACFEYQRVAATYNMALNFREKVYPEYFKSFDWGEKAEPINFEELKTTNRFMINLDYLINDYVYYNNWHKQFLKDIGRNREIIQQELSSKGLSN